jgi:TetR/AcrR family transcriptional regulator
VTTAAAAPRRTRIQQEKRELILEAALEVFSTNGFRGSTIDQIADAAGMSKPNLLYYFRSKEDIHTTLLQRLLDTWLAPLRELDNVGDPLTELRSYIRRKLEMARDYPRESRLFANEILQGAPRIKPMLECDMKDLVDEKAEVIRGWMRVRLGAVAAVVTRRAAVEVCGPIRWTSFCRYVERVPPASFPLSVPLTASLAVLTFVHPVKICVARKRRPDQALASPQRAT